MNEPTPTDDFETRLGRIRDMDASLNARLLLLAETVRQMNPRLAETADLAIERLRAAGLGRSAPAIGEHLPPFLLPNQSGRLTGLADILADGPAVVSFLRGHWCPYCRLTASALARLEETIGARHMVGITPETRRHNVMFGEESGIGYPLLTDPDNGYALSLNLAFWVDDAFAELIREFGADLAVYQSSAAWLLPVPATFVVDSGGVIVARHVDPDYRRRMEIDDLISAFKAAS